MKQIHFEVEVFWVVTPCIVVVGYQRFGSPCCLHFQGEMAELWILSYFATDSQSVMALSPCVTLDQILAEVR
jgi:hypothetical protein